VPDWILDLGPDGGEDGGRVVATGTPEQVMRSRKSFTAEALRKLLRPEERREGTFRKGAIPQDHAGFLPAHRLH